MIAAALSALLLSAAPRLEAGVSAGGGYDSNLNHADPSVVPVGSGFAAVRASGGASLDLGRSTSVYAGLRFDDEEYPAYADLTTRSAGVEVSLVQDLGEHAAIVLTPWAAQAWAGDVARDTTTLAAQLTLRVKPVRDLTLRGFYGHTSRSADDPVFSSERDRVGASAEWHALPRAYLSVAWSVERGDDVFYRASTGGFGMGRMTEAFGRPQEAYRASATIQTISPTLEIGLDRTFHLLASYEARLVRASAADLQAHSVFVGLGARL